MVIHFFKTFIALTLIITPGHALICSNTDSLAQMAHAPQECPLDVKLVQLVIAWDRIKTSADFLLHQCSGSNTVAGIGRSCTKSLRHDLVAQIPRFLCLRNSGGGCFTRSKSHPVHFKGLLRSLAGHENNKSILSAPVILREDLLAPLHCEGSRGAETVFIVHHRGQAFRP